MAQLKILVNVGAGDAVTPIKDLTFKVYRSGTLIKTFGSVNTDEFVTLYDTTTIKLENIPINPSASNVITVKSIDGEGNESTASTSASITATGGTAFTSLINHLDMRIGGVWKDATNPLLVFNGTTITNNKKTLEITDLSGSLKGIYIKPPTGGWVTTKTYRVEIEVIDFSPELNEIKGSTRTGIWAAPVVLCDLVVGKNNFEFTPTSDNTNNAPIYFLGSPTSTDYFVSIIDFKVYEV